MDSPGKTGAVPQSDPQADDAARSSSSARAVAAQRWASAWFSHHNDNRLLSAFPAREQAILAPHMEEVMLPRGHVLFEPGSPVEQVWFPYCGTMVSLLIAMNDGTTAETVTVGCESATGVGADLSDLEVEAFTRAVVHMPGRAARLPAARLAEAAEDSPVLRRLFARHAEAMNSMALQSVACNALHRVPERLARWLLTAQDRASPSAQKPGGLLLLTHEFLAQMLAVRRATVTEAVRGLQQAGLIRTRRGGVQLLDRPGLEQTACECYAVLRRRLHRLLAPL